MAGRMFFALLMVLAAVPARAETPLLPPYPQDLVMPQNTYMPPPRQVPGHKPADVVGIGCLAKTIGSDGSVSDVQVLKSTSDPALDRFAVEQSLRSRYRPAMYGGKPVAMRLLSSINFMASRNAMQPVNGCSGVTLPGAPEKSD